MSDNEKKQPSDADAKLAEEILPGRKFSLEEAIARMIGPGGMKGESPVTRLQQAETEIGTWLTTHVPDSSGALKLVLHRNVKGSKILLDRVDPPLAALVDYLRGHGRDKVLFGTNWPMVPPVKALEALPALELDEEVEAKFLAGNARRVFRL